MKGADLKQIIKAAGDTQDEAAEKLNVSRQTLNTWLSKERVSDKIAAAVKELYPDASHEFDMKLKVPELEQMIKQHIATYLQADTEMKMELGVVSKRLEDAFEEIEALKKQLLKSTK